MTKDFSKEIFMKNAARYNYPEGRYNYYPRITSWENNLEESIWFKEVSSLGKTEIDLYIHIPFCAKFCFFCGCNIKASNSKELIDSYIDNLILEWENYKNFDLSISNIYFGGGTPNSLNIDHYEKILSLFKDSYKIHLEYDPRFHNLSLLKFLMGKGLKSISMGIQDLDEKVLQSIGRETNINDVEKCLDDLAELSVEHVGIDIIYGLPNQRENSVSLLKNFIKRNPVISGISLYPFAEVPWFKEYNPNWKKDENHAKEKSLQFFNFSNLFFENNFELISFGHYLKKGSVLEKLFQENSLERNIMGFCSKKSDTLIGLGVSAISSTQNIIKQNHKIFENYMKWPTTIYTGHLKSSEEKSKETRFLEISSRKKIDLTPSLITESLMKSRHLEKISSDHYSFTRLGKHFLQYNIQEVCSV